MSIVYDKDTPKDIAYDVKIYCNVPNCKCTAINSHILQKSKYVKAIAENGFVLQMTDNHLQPLIDGDEDGNFFMILSLNNAMSLSIYCSRHDQKLFKQLEVKDMDLNSYDVRMKLSYRAYCAARAQEQRRTVFYNVNPTTNSFCKGEIFDYQRRYSHYILNAMQKGISRCYRSIKRKKYDDYNFHRYTIERKIPLCMSDCVFVEDELIASYENDTPISPMFVHALPYDDRTEIIIGYEASQKTEFIQKVVEEWSNPQNYQTALNKLMVFSNNWCVAPSYFGNNTEERNLTCEHILEMKIGFQFDNVYP